MAARILDLAGIVVNRQTIPGDTSALRPSAFASARPGSPSAASARPRSTPGRHHRPLLKACVPFSYSGRLRPQARAKIDFDVLQAGPHEVRDLAASVGIDTDVDGRRLSALLLFGTRYRDPGWQTLAVKGEQAADFLHIALTSNVHALQAGEQQPAYLWAQRKAPPSAAS